MSEQRDREVPLNSLAGSEKPERGQESGGSSMR